MEWWGESVECGVIFQPFSSRSSNFSLLWKQIEIEVDRSFEVGQQSDLFYSSPTLHWWPLDRGWIVRIRLTPVISPAACRPALMGTSTRCKELFRCSGTIFQYMNGPFLLISRSNARCLVWAKFYWIAQMDGLIARARSGRAALNIQILLHLWTIGNMAFQSIARWENTY